jgi:hypothetical protein
MSRSRPPNCSPNSTNISTLNRNMDSMIKKLNFNQVLESEIKSKDEEKISSEDEKEVLKALFDSLGGYNEKTIEGRTIKLPILIDREIKKSFSGKGRIIWYGSTSLGSKNISDYDLMFIPDNYVTQSFKEMDMDNMYKFMDNLRNQLNKATETKGFNIGDILGNAESMTEIFDTLVKIEYGENSPLGSKINNQTFTKYVSTPKEGCFKLSIIPYLWIDNKDEKGLVDENHGIVFCLFRIKYVFKQNDKIITIPIVDLSYHFCNKVNSLFDSINDWGNNYIKFDDIIYVKNHENLQKDLYLQLITAFRDEDLDKEYISKVSTRIDMLRTSAASSRKLLTGGKKKRTKKTTKGKKSKSNKKSKCKK